MKVKVTEVLHRLSPVFTQPGHQLLTVAEAKETGPKLAGFRTIGSAQMVCDEGSEQYQLVVAFGPTSEGKYKPGQEFELTLTEVRKEVI